MRARRVLTVEECVEKFHLNKNNESYLQGLSLFLSSGHPMSYFREVARKLGYEKLPASQTQKLYWQIRGYSEEESAEKVKTVQSQRGSFEHKKRKMIESGISEEEAEKKIRELATQRGKTNSETHRRESERDPTYLRSMSHQCKEFWTKKGMSEEESIKSAFEVCEKNRKRFREKLDNGEIEKGWNSTTVEYYLKQGMTIKEARLAITDRQKTFSLEKCISRHGEEKGTRVWKERQEKWRKSVFSGESCIAVGTSKIFKEFLSNFEGVTSEFFLRTSEFCFIYDLRKRGKIIEFNGDFWHCNPKNYAPDYLHPIKKMTAKEMWEYDARKESLARSKGYDYLVVWESDYKNDPKKVIDTCQAFLS